MRFSASLASDADLGRDSDFEDRAALRERGPELAEADEFIVVDASRSDPVRATDLPPDARLVRSARANRAHQQNVGARLAGGEGILFLHADTALPEGALRAIRGALLDPEVAGGGFARIFDSPSPVLRGTCALAARRSRVLGWFLGDQALFVRRCDFEAVGGFRVLRAFEDYDLCRRLKRRGRMRCLRGPARSSARRFSGVGPTRRSLHDFLLTLVYLVAGTRPFHAIQNDEINAGSDPPTPC